MLSPWASFIDSDYNNYHWDRDIYYIHMQNRIESSIDAPISTQFSNTASAGPCKYHPP